MCVLCVAQIGFCVILWGVICEKKLGGGSAFDCGVIGEMTVFFGIFRDGDYVSAEGVDGSKNAEADSAGINHC